MLIAIAVIVIGLAWRRTKRFWLYGVGAIVCHLLTVILFYADGTLENSTGDGFVTAIVREATNDGPLVAAMIIPAIAFGWAVPIWMIVTGVMSPPPSVDIRHLPISEGPQFRERD